MRTDDTSNLKVYVLTKEQYKERLENNEIDENAFYMTTTEDKDSGSSYSAAIIDVVELPTEGAQMGAIYRVPTGTFIMGDALNYFHTCYCVSELPEVGEPGVNVDNDIIIGYYNVSDGKVYGYADDRLALHFEVEQGWHPITLFTEYVYDTFDGVITDMTDCPDDGLCRLLLSTTSYMYTGYWTVLNKKNIDINVTGAETFNDTVGNTASGVHSHAEGSDTTASGTFSHAEGNYTTAYGYASHTEGHYTTASGDYSHAEGCGTTASGRDSHAEGNYTTASGECSHAEGDNTTASGECSHAEGYGTVASANYQHAQGKYNIDDAGGKYAHIVGNGTYNGNRSNAHTLDWEGNGWFAGSVEATAIILKSPNGTRFRIAVDGNGSLTATKEG